ncbi:hypothetical protein KCU85_g6863, partial [Aureobasidium melanogenum]
MPDQQATAGASMHDEQVTNKHPDHQDAPATDQQASDYTTTYQATHDSTSSLDNHDEDFLNDPVTTYTLMLDHFSKGNIEEGEKLAQELVLWGPYPEKVHARLFLAQVGQDALMHANLAVKEATEAVDKYEENDDEKLKLLNLAERTLTRVKAEEGFGVIEEVDEEDDQVDGGAEADQEVKKDDDREVEEGDSGKLI